MLFGADCFFQAEDGIRDLVRSRGLGDVYKRQAWRDLVRDTHPDVLQSRGVPPEAMKLAERRLQLILSLIHI